MESRPRAGRGTLLPANKGGTTRGFEADRDGNGCCNKGFPRRPIIGYFRAEDMVTGVAHSGQWQTGTTFSSRALADRCRRRGCASVQCLQTLRQGGQMSQSSSTDCAAAIGRVPVASATSLLSDRTSSLMRTGGCAATSTRPSPAFCWYMPMCGRPSRGSGSAPPGNHVPRPARRINEMLATASTFCAARQQKGSRPLLYRAGRVASPAEQHRDLAYHHRTPGVAGVAVPSKAVCAGSGDGQQFQQRHYACRSPNSAHLQAMKPGLSMIFQRHLHRCR